MSSDAMSPINPASSDAPYVMKERDQSAKKLTPTTKSYLNEPFLKSHDARIIRILCEFQEPAGRLNANKVKGTILFFGSARAMIKEDFDATMADLEAKLPAATGEAKAKIEEKIAGLRKVEWMCEWSQKAEELSRLLTHWAVTDPLLKQVFRDAPDYLREDLGASDSASQPLVVTTGGGPGLMEAANRGAASVPGAITMGMGISLPFENGLNPYVTPGLAFEFHYFFTRKFWMMYSAKALIIAPGGFGTMDELFELLTLRQTKKIPDLPIVLLCSKFWKTIINWQAIADFGTISQKEVDSLFFADDAQSAFEYIRQHFVGKTDEFACISPSLGAKAVNLKSAEAAPPMMKLPK